MSEPEYALPDNERLLRQIFTRHVTSSILAMFGAMAGGLANSILAGMLFGAAGLAVMSVAAPFYFLFSVIGSLVGVGGAIAAAYSLGRDDSAGADEAFSLSLWMGVVFSLLLGAAGFFCLEDLLYVFGATEEIHGAAFRYCSVYLWGGFGTALFYLPFNFLRLVGRLRLILALFLGMAALNVALDVLFTMVLGYGIEGIALGTAVSSVFVAAVGIAFLLRGASAYHLDYHVLGKRGGRTALSLLRLGSPPAVNNLLTFFRLVLLNRLLLMTAGELGLAAFSVVTALENFSLIILSGLAQGTTSFISVFTKEYDTASVRSIEKQAHIIGLGLIGALTVVILLFPTEICGLFGIVEPMELEVSSEAVWIFACSLPFSVCGYLMFFYYQAAGFTGLANILVFARTFFFILIPAWLLAPVYGLPGIWWSFSIASVSPLAIMLFVQRYYARQGYAGFLLQDLSAERDGAYLSFSVPTDVRAIVESVDRIEDFCGKNELKGKENLLVRMAMEELLMSIKEHSFSDTEEAVMDVRILLIRKSGGLTIVLRIRNAGKLFNPIEYYECRQEQDPLALGDALGIAMVLKTADAIHYKTTFGINNLTVLIDRRDEEGVGNA